MKERIKNGVAVANLSKHFDGVYALTGVSFEFKAGAITGVIGPNGSGKSTLINALTGVLPIDGGEIIFSGAERLTKICPHDVPALGMTRTFQDVRLFEQMTVLDNVLLALTERGVFKSFFEKHKAIHLEKAEEALKTIELLDKHAELAHDLSYGQRKLLEIARVISMTRSGEGDIRTIFFDEPFAGLFPQMIKTVSSILKNLRAENIAIVLVEHNIDLIRELCDVVYVLDSGKVLAMGEPETVLAQKDVMEAYLGE